MKRIVCLLIAFIMANHLWATEKILGSSGSTGRWVKVARIQNVNPVNGSECSTFSGSVNVQTDYGQAGTEQYYAIFSFGSRAGIKPLLQEYGDAANRAVGDLSRVEWRVYTDTQGWHYLWFWQSNYSKYTIFDYAQSCITEYWTFEAPPVDFTMVWSSLTGDRQYTDQTFATISVRESLGIGVDDPGAYKLAVNGNIHAKEVKVDVLGWPDYVFDPGYELPTLTAIQKYIQEKGHLIDMPSAREVETNGLELGEMDKLLLKKIEELTLYTIQQENKLLEMASLKLELEEQRKEIQELRKIIKNRN